VKPTITFILCGTAILQSIYRHSNIIFCDTELSKCFLESLVVVLRGAEITGVIVHKAYSYILRY